MTATTPRPRDVAGQAQPAEQPRRVKGAVWWAVLGGIALVLAAPPADIWPLVVVGPALLTLAVAGRSSRAAFGLGVLFGIAYFGPLLWWLTNLSLLAWAALVVVQALFAGGHGVLVAVLVRSRWWPLTVALSWVAVEAVRGAVPLGGFPWGRLGFSQADAPSLGWAALGGVPVLTFLAALVGSGLAALVLDRRRRALVLVALSTGVWLTGGLLPAPAGSGETLTVAVVQGALPRERGLDDFLRAQESTEVHAGATARLVADVRDGTYGEPDFVVWPENSVDTDPASDREIESAVRNAVADVAAPVLIGGFSTDVAGRRYNVGQLWLPGEGPVAEHRKRQLVPFGEYVPFRPLFGWVEQLQYVKRDLTPGTGDGVLDVPGARVGDVICYEIAYDNHVAASVAAGAELLVVQTNNATYMLDGQIGESVQQLAMAQVRAVEHRRPVIVASTTGISAVIAADGSLTASTGTWREELLVEDVTLGDATTPSRWVAPWFVWIASIVTVAAVALALLPSYRRVRFRRAG